MWIVIAVVVIAVVLILVAAPSGGVDHAVTVEAVDDDGLHLARVDGQTDGRVEAIGWASIFEVAVMTRPRLGGTWYGFEVATETSGRVVVDGDGPAEAFIAHSHHPPGLDHTTLADALTRRRGRAVCYRR